MQNLFNSITNFYDHPIFIIVGGVTVTLTFLGIIYRIVGWFVGITPVVFRLGTALAKRRIAIFGSESSFSSLKDSLVRSGLFKEKNIIHIKLDNIDKAKSETIFLVDWESFGERINEVFVARKNDQTSIVIYAKPASIEREQMSDIGNRANTIVVNFRGRLINDVMTSLITTSYDSR